MYFFQPPYKGREIIGLLYIILECFGLFGINNEDLVYLEYVCWALIPRSEMCPGASSGSSGTGSAAARDGARNEPWMTQMAQ